MYSFTLEQLAHIQENGLNRETVQKGCKELGFLKQTTDDLAFCPPYLRNNLLALFAYHSDKYKTEINLYCQWFLNSHPLKVE